MKTKSRREVNRLPGKYRPITANLPLYFLAVVFCNASFNYTASFLRSKAQQFFLCGMIVTTGEMNKREGVFSA
jgi:hypothetical protein